VPAPDWLSRHVADRPRPSRSTVVWLGALLSLWAVVYLRRLDTPLAVYDEGIYAASARLLLRTGSVLVPRIQGGLGGIEPHLFLEKPPLVIWLQAGSIALLGPTELAVRLPSVLFVLGTALLVFWWGARVVSRRAGGFAAVVFLATPHVFEGMNGGRDGATDPALVFFGTLSLALLWVGLTDRRGRYVVAAGVAGGLAALVKGVAVFTFVAAAVGLLVAYRDRVQIRPVVAAAGAALLVGGWWPALMWARFGERFVRPFLLDQVVGRAAESSVAFGTGYLTTLPWSFGPWLYLLGPLAVAVALAVRRTGDRSERVFAAWLGAWAALVFGVFALVGNHLWYVLPAYVPLALLVGWGLALTVEGDLPARVGVVAGTLATLFLSYRTASVHYPLVVLVGGALVALAPTLSSAASRFGLDAYPDAVRAVAACWLVLFAAGLTVPMYEFGGAYTQRSLGESIDQRTAGDATVHIGPGVGGGLYPLSFYAGRTFSTANASQLDSDREVRLAVVTNRTLAGLNRSHTAVRGGAGPGGNWSVVAFDSS